MFGAADASICITRSIYVLFLMAFVTCQILDFAPNSCTHLAYIAPPSTNVVLLCYPMVVVVCSNTFDVCIVCFDPTRSLYFAILQVVSYTSSCLLQALHAMYETSYVAPGMRKWCWMFLWWCGMCARSIVLLCVLLLGIYGPIALVFHVRRCVERCSKNRFLTYPLSQLGLWGCK